mgnify:CR=1 FL=1
MIRKTLLASLLVSVVTADIAIAQTPTDTRSMGNVSSQAQSSLDQKSGMQLTDEERSLAKQWMLKESDWIKYRKIMSGPRGIWSPGLDPLTLRHDLDEGRISAHGTGIGLRSGTHESGQGLVRRKPRRD